MTATANAAPGSSRASSAGSSTSEPVSFVGDPGPGFNAEHAAGVEHELRAEAEREARDTELGAFELPHVEEESVRSVLLTGGDMLHALAGVGEHDWRATQSDLDRIAPPATRILNRYQFTRAVAAKSDEAALVMGLGLYSWRSLLERQTVFAAERSGLGSAPQERPASSARGGPAPAATEPPPPAPEPPPMPRMDVVDGYMTHAERIRQARERPPDAQPRQDQHPA
jgi:hypothetical protein